jgi:uncharacterized delta-60 repeat protein
MRNDDKNRRKNRRKHGEGFMRKKTLKQKRKKAVAAILIKGILLPVAVLFLLLPAAARADTPTNTPTNTPSITPTALMTGCFGTNGTVVTSFGGTDDELKSCALQSDGKIVAAGFTNSGGTYDFALARYNPDGSLDMGFGAGGKVVTAIGPASDMAYSVAIQNDGKIVAAGTSNNGSMDCVGLARYNTDGSLDTTFGAGGKVNVVVGGSTSSSYSMAIQPDGMIVVAGEGYNGSNFDFLLARYTTTGALDTGFNGTGYVITPINSANDTALSVAIQSDGKIVEAGYSDNGSYNNVALARFSNTGALDGTFGTGGKVTTVVSSAASMCNAIAIQPDGKIVAAGQNSSNTFIALRYLTTGVLDTGGFGTSGIASIALGGTNQTLNSVVIQPDGNIAFGGYAYTTNWNFAILRLTTNGAADASFGTGGLATFTIGTANNNINSICLQGDNKLLVGGIASSTNTSFALGRFSSGGVLDTGCAATPTWSITPTFTITQTQTPPPTPTALPGAGVTWYEKTAGALFAKRCNFGSLVYNNLMWVIAGNESGGPVHDVFYSSDGLTWTQATAAAAFAVRGNVGCCVYNNKMWVIGGYGASADLHDVWSSSDGVTWTQATAAASFSIREDPACLVYNNKMWIIGGWSSTAETNDVWWSTDGATWTRATAAAAFSARDSMGACVFDPGGGGRMWIFGGGVNNTPQNDSWWSTDGVTWTQATGTAFTARIAQQAYTYGGKIWQIAGYDGNTTYYNDVWCSSDGANWTSLGNASFTARCYPGGVSFNNQMWIYGGIDASSTYYNDVWYSPQIPTPTITPYNGTPTNTWSISPTVTRTGTPTATPTRSPTSTRTGTPTITPSRTATPSRSPTPTYTPVVSPTFTGTFTRTGTPSSTGTITPTFTGTPTRSPTPTYTPTFSPTYTLTASPTFTRTNTYTFTGTMTTTFTGTSTRSPTPTYTRTFTVSPTFTGTGTPTSTQTFTGTWTPTPTGTPTIAPTGTITMSPTNAPNASGYLGNQSVIWSGNSLQLNTAAKKLALGFSVPYAGKIVNSIRINFWVVGTSPTYNISIQQDNGLGLPDGNPISGGGPVPYTFSGFGWSTVSGFTAALNAGQAYHIVIEYNGGTIDGTDYTQFAEGMLNHHILPYDQYYDYAADARLFDGTAWSGISYLPRYALQFSDATDYGNPFSSNGNQSINTVNYAGEVFRVQSDVQVDRIGFFISRQGTVPSDDLHYGIYDITGSFTVTTGTLLTAAASSTSTQWVDTSLGGPFTLAAGRLYRAYLYSPSSDTSNYYTIEYQNSGSGGAFYDALTYDGTQSYFQYSSSSGGTWTSMTDSDCGFRFSFGVVPTWTPTASMTGTQTQTPTFTQTPSPTAAPPASGYIGNQSVLDGTYAWFVYGPAYKVAYSFTLPAAKTLSTLRLYINAIIGTCPRYYVGIQGDDGTGRPNGIYIPGGGPVSTTFIAGWNLITGYSALLSTNTVYHAVIEYDTVSGDLIDPSHYAFVGNGSTPFHRYIPYDQRYDGAAESIYSDGSWTLPGRTLECVLDFSDTTSYGNPYVNVSNYQVQGANCYGEYFRNTYGTVQVDHIGFFVKRSGSTPNDDLLYVLENVTQTRVEAAGVLWSAAASQTGAQWVDVNLPAPVTLINGNVYRAWLKSPNSDTSNFYTVNSIRTTGGTSYNQLTYDGDQSYEQQSADTGSTWPTSYTDTDIGFRFSYGVPPTPTLTITLTPTASPTGSNTPTVSPTRTITATRTVSPTFTATPTFTITPTSTITVSPTFSITLTSSVSSTPTFSATPTFTVTMTGSVSNTPTYSRTPTYTVTMTSSVSNTPTYTTTPTFTVTATSSVSNTPTFSRTPTYTVTMTSSVSSTPTFSTTPTYTVTMTSSVSNTPTFSITPTFTMTVTQSITQTVTQTSTPTFSITPTFTATRTLTFTVTDTISSNTPTVTPTSTPTFTVTASSSVSSTSTFTITLTFSVTATSSLSDTPTSTATPTFSITPTYTVTVTPTFSVTPTFTFTSTGTSSNTATFTFTPTGTATNTPTYTFTLVNTASNTPTYTFTPTGSASNTATFTLTLTSSVTNTPTYTFTPTGSVSNTATFTLTLTSSVTNTPTYTFTLVNTASNTATYTFTPTSSVSNTPTYTFTLVDTASNTPTYTFTLTSSASPTPTFTATPMDTDTFTATSTITLTATSTATHSTTPTVTDTGTPLPSLTDTPTGTETTTNTYTRTASPTLTATGTGTLIDTATFTVTPTWTDTPPFTPTISPTWTITQTFTNSPTPNIDKALDRNYVNASKGEELHIRINASTPNVDVKVKIYDLTGEIIRHLGFTAPLAGWNEYPWDLTNDAGKTVGRGMYFVYIEAEGRNAIRRVYILK